MRTLKVKHAKAKLTLIGWSLLSATVLTLLISFLTADVDPSFFDSQVLSQDILGVQKTENLFVVEEITDGDTIVVSRDGIRSKVRLLGIDTPETKHPNKPVECFGEEASSRLAELLYDQQVRLDADVTQADMDRYGRLLRYVYLPDGTHVNKLMIQEGFAFEFTYQSKPYFYQAEFMAAQQEARANVRGLWSDLCTSF